MQLIMEGWAPVARLPDGLAASLLFRIPSVMSTDVHVLMQQMGERARAASTLMARASAAHKNTALRELARLLGEAGAQLADANAKDIARAEQNGLSAPMVDRLRLTPRGRLLANQVFVRFMP